MSARDRSLKSILTGGTLVLAGLAFAAALLDVALTTLLHRTTQAIETSMESVHLAEQAEISLLLHGRARSAIVRRELAAGIQGRLARAEAYVDSDRERLIFDKAQASTREYVDAAHDSTRPEAEVAALMAAAYAAINDLVNINVAQARAEARSAARVDYLANIGGLGLALLIVIVAAFFVYWVHGPLMRPVRELTRAMNQFGRGDHTARARVEGPRELKGMSERFNDMAGQIERQREHQRAFVAGVAHDLRTPLSTLLLSTETACSDPSLPPDHRVRSNLERNARQLRSLDRMVSDFLDVGLIETGHLELRIEVRDLRDVVRSATGLFEGTSPQHDVVMSLPPEPAHARIDPLRIEQVITNLISNAIKYSPDGGDVEVHLERQEDDLVLAVTDRGIGILPQAQERLFEPFRRGVSHEGIPGVGLGLYIVRRIVEAHHGRIEVDSTVGAGSTFRVVLPKTRP